MDTLKDKAWKDIKVTLMGVELKTTPVKVTFNIRQAEQLYRKSTGKNHHRKFQHQQFKLSKSYPVSLTEEPLTYIP